MNLEKTRTIVRMVVLKVKLSFEIKSMTSMTPKKLHTFYAGKIFSRVILKDRKRSNNE